MKITFKTNQYFILNEKVNIPIPDGYHYSNSGSGGNAGWFYVVPKDVSLEENHIEAKPFSFGITANKIGDFPFEAQKIEVIKQIMIANGYLDKTVTVYQIICSEHCGFLYQNWTDPSDATYNKINGFLFAGDELYQFHVYANHSKKIAHEPKTIDGFISVVMSWMKKVYLCGEEPEKESSETATVDNIKAAPQKTKKPSTQEQTAVVDNAWEVTLPKGFIYSTDKSIIGEHRNIIIMEDKKGNNFEDSFNASISFTSMVVKNEDAVSFTPIYVGIMLDDNKETVVRSDDGLYVSYYYQNANVFDELNGDSLDVFRMFIGCEDKISAIQVFFNNSSKSLSEKTDLVDKIARSIRLRGEEMMSTCDYEATDNDNEKESMVSNTPESLAKDSKVSFTQVTPDEELYPHYKIIRSVSSVGGFGLLFGASVVVNSTGTEYNFIPLRSMSEDEHTDEKFKDIYNRIIAKDTENYDLYEQAVEMHKLFHVDYGVFDSNRDRESELEQGLMHRAYMMSGLRSFAWTLADYCKQLDCMPKDIDSSVASRIADFVANADWLNYDGKTYCKGLCSGSDLHVFFVPDSISQSDKEQLLPSQEDLDRVKKTKEKFPSYNEILCEVHSLNALRKDLEYVYPAVKQLWNKLEKSRDYNEALLGNDADIVYAWCALALAAKEPFFSEDGPTSCDFYRPMEEIESYWYAEQKEKMLKEYKNYIDTDPKIVIEGSQFVFTGLIWGGYDDYICEYILEKGGFESDKVTDDTDYLIIRTCTGETTKFLSAIEQKKKRNSIHLIFINDFVAAVARDYNDDLLLKTFNSSYNKEFDLKCERDGDYEYITDRARIHAKLTGYFGDDVNIVVPDKIKGIPITRIDQSTFCAEIEQPVDGNTTYEIRKNIAQLESIIIPDSVIEIGSFIGCASLKYIYLSSKITKISKLTFDGCVSLKAIYIPESVKTIMDYAFQNCDRLTDVYIPNNKSIRTSAFDNSNSNNLVFHGPEKGYAQKYAKKIGASFLADNCDRKTIEEKLYSEATGQIFKINKESSQKTKQGEQQNETTQETVTMTSLSIKVLFENAEPIFKQIDTSTKYEIKLVEPEYFDWKTCNRVRNHNEDIDGLTDVVALSNEYYTEAGENCGNFVDVLDGEGREEEIKDFIDQIDAKSEKEKAKKIILVAVTDANSKLKISSCCFDYASNSFTCNEKIIERQENIQKFVKDLIDKIDKEGTEGSVDRRRTAKSNKKNSVGNESTAPTEEKFTIKDGVLKKYAGSTVDVIIPDGVIEIGKKAFQGNTKIKSVTLSDSVRRVEDSAFEGCSSLTTVKMHDKVEYLGKRVFKGCSKLKSFVVPGNVVALFDESFYDCESLKYIVLHINITYFGSFLFPFNNSIDVYGEYNDQIEYSVKSLKGNKYSYLPEGINKPICTLSQEQLKKNEFIICGKELVSYLGNDEVVIVPDGVTSIAINGMSYRSIDGQNTKQILLPNSVTTIKRYAFDDQKELRSLEIPYGVKAINMGVVSGCEMLEYVTIPETATSIDVLAFHNCSSLKSVNIPKSVRKISHDAFDGTENVTIYGEYGSEAYNFAKKHSIEFRTGLPIGVPKPREKDDKRYENTVKSIKEKAERERIETEARVERARQEAEERERRRKAEEARRIAEAERLRKETEQRAIEEKRLLEQRKVELNALLVEKEYLLKTIAENKGWFGQKAATRKAAKARLAEVQIELGKYTDISK